MDGSIMTPSSQSADPIARRGPLASRANPNLALDYVVLIDSSARVLDYRLRLRYVPDKLILDPTSFDQYLSALAGHQLTEPEEIALTVLDDINNQVVPRWVQVTLRQGQASGPDAASALYCMLVEDRQPNWDNPELLSRLPAPD